MIIVKRCGIRFKPPALIILFEEDVQGKMKLKKCVMPIRNFRRNSNINFHASELKARHAYLETVPMVTIEKMLRLLQENLKGNTLEDSLVKVNREFSVDSDEDLNKLDTEQLDKKKEIMDLSFNKNAVRPEDPSFVYDKRVDYEDHEKIESAWDQQEDDDDTFWS